jgi:broad specificity phosphatase PhoE
MKPKRIILIRHGESEGNVDKTVYQRKPDYALDLTRKGRDQAFNAGARLKDLVGKESICFYGSPFYRAKQTYEQIKKFFPDAPYREDVRLREQEWTTYKMREDVEYINAERDEVGHFFYRFKDSGESCADVYDRVTTFLDTLHRDFEKEDFPENCAFSGHGMTNRVILMRFFHWTVDEFELVRNPDNCEFYILERYDDKGKFKYKLITEPKRYEKLNRKF